MTVLAASGRVWHRNWLVYRRLWHRSLAFGFLQPVLFLTAMGLGLGTLMNPSDLERLRRRSTYIDLAWAGPPRRDGDADGDLRVDLSDHEQDHVGPELRGHSLHAAPHPAHRPRRAGLVGLPDRHRSRGRFLFVLFLFGIPRSPMAFLAIPFTVLTGLAFSSCLIAFTATQKNDVGFSAVFRFIINPLFLFSGTFFPLTQLPEPLQLIAWADAALPRRRARPRGRPRHARPGPGSAAPRVPACDVHHRRDARRAKPHPADGGLGG